MTEISVITEQRAEGVDPASVWAFVADPANVARWAPFHHAGYMGTELPGVGHTIFLHRGRRERANEAWRCRIEAWEAGHRVRCSLETPGAATAQELEVVVENLGSGALPVAAISLAYRGDVPAALVPIYQWRVSAIGRRALRRVFAAVPRS